MRRSLIPMLLAALLVALALAVAGCGGGKSSSATTEAATTESTTEETTTAETTTEETTTEDVGVSGIASAGNCRELVTLSVKLGQAFTGTGGNVEKTAQWLEEFAARTPEEIRADFQLVADAYGKIAEALEGVDLSSGSTPSPEALQRLQEIGDSIDQDALDKASANIDAWVTENCK